MATGREEYARRRQYLTSYGKDLARRAKSRCEICETSGIPLEVFEVPPEEKEPRFERCILICEKCRKALEKATSLEGSDEWRVLERSIWSEIAPVQVASVRLLRKMGPEEDWAREALEGLYLEDEVSEWANAE